MFPVERKNEFLRYVMITEPYDEWSGVVFNYIKENNNIKNWKEGFDFVVKHSDDPSRVAYNMVRYGHAEFEWAKEVIENDTTGSPPLAAYLMVGRKHVKTEWAKEVIKNATIGDPSRAAYFMVKDGFAEPEWGRKVIENATTDGQSIIAYHMVIGGHATQEWYEEIKRKNDVSS